MKRIRFNIASLLVVVFLVAVSVAGLREATELWDSGLFSLTLVVLLVSILLGLNRTEKRRAFWIGFALFGWTYFGFSLVPSIESRLITTKWLAYLDSKVSDRSIVHLRRVWDTWSDDPTQNNRSIPSTSIAVSLQGKSATSGNWFVAGDWTSTRGVTGAAGGSTMNFIRIGHSLLILIAEIVGKLLSRHVHTSEESTSEHRESVAFTGFVLIGGFRQLTV